MGEYRYTRSSLIWDYLRGAGGLLVVAGPLAFAPILGFVQILFGTLALLFAGYVFRTWQRSQTTIWLDERGIATVGPFGRSIEWTALSHVKLGYFATRRDRVGGWMQLVLRGGGTKIAADTELEGFDQVLAAVAEAARRNDLELSQATVENFAAAGLEVADLSELSAKPPAAADEESG